MKTNHGKAVHSSRAAHKWVAKVNDLVIPMPDRLVNETVLRTQGSVPEDHVILRDHNDPHDPVIPPGSKVDLAEGSEFYSVPKCNVTPSRPRCEVPAKHVVTVDDKPGTFVKTEQTGRSLRDFFGLVEAIDLIWDLESPNDQLIADEDAIDIRKGNVFVTRRSSCEIELVDITINGTVFPVTPRNYAESEIRAIPEPDIPATDELSQLIAGQFKLIELNEIVEIVGGEIFASNAPSGGAS